MDRDSPVTEAILEAVAQLLADDFPKEFGSWFEAKKHLVSRIDHFSEGVVPHSSYRGGRDERREILDRLQQI